MALDRRERSGELVEALLCAQEGHQAGLWTAMPGILQSFDATKKTCTVQPALKALRQLPDGTQEWVTMPLLVDVVVQFAGGGGYDVTFPLSQGDEGLVVFAARCIDAWWQSGGVQVQAELRMHDLSDGFFVPGVSSLPKVQADAPISTSEFQARSKDGKRMLRISGTEVEAKTDTSGVRASPGRLDLTGTLYINGKPYLGHEHTDVTPGGGLSGGVTDP